MAQKRKKSGSDSKSEEEFSVILGTKTIRKEEPDEEEQQAERKEEKRPVPQEPEAPPKPVKPASPEDLLKKKQDIERMIASLEEARATSDMPAYSYSHLKRRYKAELAKINTLLNAVSKPAPAKAKGPPPRTLEQVDRMNPKGNGAVTPILPKGRVRELAQRLGKMESVQGMIPSLKSQIASLNSKMNEYEEVVKRLRSDEQALAEELPHIKRSLSAMKAKRRPKKVKAAVPPKEQGPTVDAVMEIMSDKVETLARKLTETFEALNSRIDQVSVVDEVETMGYVKDLKKDIKRVRSELATFMKKEDLKKMVLQPVIEGEAGSVPVIKKAKAKAMKKVDIVSIDDLGGEMGKDVTIECSLSLLKTVKEKGICIYWYRIEDGTGESILTSPNEIKEKKAVLKGSVKKTKTGSVYVLFKRLIE